MSLISRRTILAGSAALPLVSLSMGAAPAPGSYGMVRRQNAALDAIVDVERWMARLDQAVEEWKIRKQDLFIQHFTTPLMDRGSKTIANYIRTRRFRAVSLRSQDAVRTQAQAILERIEKEAQQPENNETQESVPPENPAAPGS